MVYRELYDWRCPACNANVNSQGTEFSGSRAVALHMAGKIKAGDHTHRKWATGNTEIDIYDPDLKRTINTLANPFEEYITLFNQDRAKRNLQMVQQILEQRDENDNPDVVAFRYLKDIETSLHQCVCESLKESFGEEKDNWWIMGIPLTLRKELATRCEENNRKDEPFKYTYLIDLKTIIKQNRQIFEPRLRFIDKHTAVQDEFLDSIGKVNEIRNRTMHPIHAITADDIVFLKNYYGSVKLFIQA